MIRTSRRFVQNVPVHIVIYGYNRAACFYTEDDCRLYLYQLLDSLKQYDIELHAYVLIPNHVHLLITQKNEYGLDDFVRHLSLKYQKYIHNTYNISHPIWQKNYKAIHIQPALYLIKHYQYIELKPVKEKMVDHPSEYFWSSYDFHAMNKKDYLINDHDIFCGLSKNIKTRRKHYRNMCDMDLSESVLKEVNYAIQSELAMGDKTFIESIQKQLYNY